MMNSKDAEVCFEELKKAIPSSNVLALRQLEALKDHMAELEYLIADLAEGLEDDGLNKRVEDVLSSDNDEDTEEENEEE